MSAHDPEPRLTPDSEAAALALLAETLEAVAPDPDARARLVAACQGPERYAPWAHDVARVFQLGVGDVQDALRRIDDPTAWTAGLWPGSELLTTPGMSRRTALIARLPAGMRIARHRHAARELTYVLDGDLIENDHVRYGSGSLVDMPCGSEHEIAVGPESACLVVFGIAGPG